MIAEVLRYCLDACALAAYATIAYRMYEKFRLHGAYRYLYASALFAINFIHGIVNLMR